MVATLQHACNRKSDTDPTLFRNDANNVAALQSARKQKKRMEEAALLQQKQLKEATDNLRTQFREERDDLHRKMNSVTEDAADNQARWDNAWQDLHSQLSSMSSSNGQQRTEIESLKQTISVLEKKVPNGREDNCLPFQYHNSTVMIVNLRNQMALDAGGDGGNIAYAWEFNVDNQNQIFKLAKYDGNPSPDSYWTISRNDDNNRKLHYQNAGTGDDVHVGTNLPGKTDHWMIGRGSSSSVASWVIKNVEFNTYIEMDGNTKNNGTHTRSFEFSNRYDANWVIIPLTMAN